MPRSETTTMLDMHQRFYVGSIAEKGWGSGQWSEPANLERIASEAAFGAEPDSDLKRYLDDWLHYCGLVEIAVARARDDHRPQ